MYEEKYSHTSYTCVYSSMSLNQITKFSTIFPYFKIFLITWLELSNHSQVLKVMTQSYPITQAQLT